MRELLILTPGKTGLWSRASSFTATPARAKTPPWKDAAGSPKIGLEVRVKFSRITVNPAQMGGVPCIRRLRIPVATVVSMIAEGMTEDEILDAYPNLERADIREALQYAAEAVRDRELPLAT